MLDLEILSVINEKTEAYKSKYPNIDREYVLKDIALFTEYRDFCKTDRQSIQDAHNLEIFRRFDKDFLSNRGVTYFDIFEDIDRFPLLRHTSVITCSSDLYRGRYLLPICTINGDVMSHMGYDKFNPRGKYEVSRVEWIHQKRMLGNLESLSMYDGNEIFIVEGFFDAYRINESMGKKSIATLGSRKSKTDAVMFDILKRKGHKLVYVPDHNDAGMNAIKNYKWDDIYAYPYEYGDLDSMYYEQREDEFKHVEYETNESLNSVET